MENKTFFELRKSPVLWETISQFMEENNYTWIYSYYGKYYSLMSEGQNTAYLDVVYKTPNDLDLVSLDSIYDIILRIETTKLQKQLKSKFDLLAN